MNVADRAWGIPPTELGLLRDEVHVWRAALDLGAAQVQRLAETLSVDEKERAERFHFEQHRQRFIVGRGVLRTILGRYLDIEPSQLQFCYGHRGKPTLAEAFGGGRLRFNLSHSQGLALYAIALDREIGIDLEHIRPMADAEQIAKRFFSPREHATILALPENEKQQAFFNCWTRKEAYLKAIAEGLAHSLDQVEVTLAPGEPAQLLNITRSPDSTKIWSIKELTPASGYVAAIVVEGDNWCLRCWQG
ncbi:MAG: 4'-phosphopantetheinyl transferase superfamily protein [Aphanothece sp. CMT-3BRIN-NPC111]|jgi:4'-phosphopantetheinyl transferase|nr:4'-phosphopantetheinyl transferase superfamily protein [Aphanothece sp. CMT-3BRIN-NPC111]